MFEALARLFTQKPDTSDPLDPSLAVAALLVHLAVVDGTRMPAEDAAIARALEEQYGLLPQEVEKLVDRARLKNADAVDLYQFTSILSGLEEDQRVEIVRMMWQVVFADGHNHELEDNMVWRVAELIGVSARQRTILRNQIKNS